MTQNSHIQNLFRQQTQPWRSGVAGIVPKPVSVDPVLSSDARTIIERGADQINNSAIGDGIEPEANFMFCVNGFDKLLVIWYHIVDGPKLLLVGS